MKGNLEGKGGVVGCVRRGIRGDHNKYTDQKRVNVSGKNTCQRRVGQHASGTNQLR